MEIIEVKIEDLKPAEYNPRAMTDLEAKNLEESLDAFGVVEPLVVNKYEGRENVIIGGHRRYDIAKKRKMETVPVFYVSLPIEKEKELNLRLNKNTGHWDWGMLANFDEELLKEVGFNKYELNEIFDLLLSKKEATTEQEENEKEMIITFPNCDEMDKAEKELREILDKKGIKYKVSC